MSVVWWEKIEGVKNIEISTEGKLRNSNTQKLITPRVINGYKEFTGISTSTGNPCTYKVHICVAKAFNKVDNMDFDYIVFKNGDKSDASSNNLAWVSKYWAMNYYRRNNYIDMIPDHSKDSNKVEQYSKDGILISTYNSYGEASRCIEGADKSKISECCAGKRKTHKGFIWKLA